MTRSNNLKSVLQLGSATLVLAILLRTWVVMGLIEPLEVQGSSMAPHYRGATYCVDCSNCGHRFEVSTDFIDDQTGFECLVCGQQNKVAAQTVKRGDRLVVDRAAYLRRVPRRWEPIVFYSPTDGQLTIKRVVGLPGESVELRQGDVWIDGKIPTKKLASLRSMQILVHEETEKQHRWQGEHWQWKDNYWQTHAGDDWNWLEYRNNKPITDDIEFNAGLSRQVHVVRDLSLSTTLYSQDGAECAIRFQNGEDQGEWTGRVRGEVHIEAFAFEGEFQVFIDGKKVFSGLLSQGAPENGPLFEIGIRSGEAMLSNLEIARDLYHTSLNESHGLAAAMAPTLLKNNELFVVGDNPTVSLDSRQWGPLPVRLLVGRPLAAR